MRKASAVFLSTLTLVALIAVPVAAAPPLDVSITAIETLPVTEGGSFAASGPAVDAGLICAGGTTSNGFVGPTHGTNPVRFQVNKTFHCDGSSDTFTLRLRVALDVNTGDTTANWKVLSGTGPYSSLKGHGTLIGTPIVSGESITDVYSGSMQ
jgi:hypothetical protein